MWPHVGTHRRGTQRLCLWGLMAAAVAPLLHGCRATADGASRSDKVRSEPSHRTRIHGQFCGPSGAVYFLLQERGDPSMGRLCAWKDGAVRFLSPRQAMWREFGVVGHDEVVVGRYAGGGGRDEKVVAITEGREVTLYEGADCRGMCTNPNARQVMLHLYRSRTDTEVITVDFAATPPRSTSWRAPGVPVGCCWARGGRALVMTRAGADGSTLHHVSPVTGQSQVLWTSREWPCLIVPRGTRYPDEFLVRWPDPAEDPNARRRMCVNKWDNARRRMTPMWTPEMVFDFCVSPSGDSTLFSRQVGERAVGAVGDRGPPEEPVLLNLRSGATRALATPMAGLKLAGFVSDAQVAYFVETPASVTLHIQAVDDARDAVVWSYP